MIKNSLLVCISLSVAIVLAEIGLRLMGIAYPEFNRLDASLGWSPRLNTEGFHAIEGRAWMKTNAAGFRDVDHTTKKPSQTFRIAVLGDSIAEGREVTLDKVFWKVMEMQLQSCNSVPNRKYEVLGFAVNGYGTAQQFIVLKNHVWRYQPDSIMLAFFAGNDVWNNSRELDGHKDRPYYIIQNKKLVLKNDYLKSDTFKTRKSWTNLKHGIYNQMRTLQVARQAYKKIRYTRKSKSLPLTKQISAGLNNNIYRPPTTRAWKQAWQVTESLIQMMDREIKNHGQSKFWIASLSTPAQAYPSREVRRSIADSLGVSDLSYPDRRVAALAKSSNIPFVALAPQLQKYAQTNNVRLHGSKAFAGGHWNEIGHQIAGKRLAEIFCRSQAHP